jgi:hypothetical protein
VSLSHSQHLVLATQEIISRDAGQVNKIGKKRMCLVSGLAWDDELRVNQSDDCSEGDFLKGVADKVGLG